MAIQMPSPQRLRVVIDELIQQNKALEYPATRFIGKVSDEEGLSLIYACTDLIFSLAAVEALEKVLIGHPALWPYRIRLGVQDMA